jgi:hypothetical protein
VALDYYNHFLEGEPDYQTDDKWFEWMTMADAEITRRESANNIDNTDQVPSVVAPPSPYESVRRSEQDELRDGSEQEEDLSGTYGFEPARTIEANVYRANRNLWRERNNVSMAVPILAFPQLGGIAEIYFDPSHPRLKEDQIEVKELVISEIALIIRERYYERFPYSYVYDHLRRMRLPDYSRINLTRQANHFVTELYPRINRSFISGRTEQSNCELKDLLTQEEIRQLGRIIAESGGDQRRLDEVLGNGEFLKWVPYVMSRLIRQMPERFLDNKLFALPLKNLPTGLSPGERDELGKANASLVANLLEDLANATKSIYGNNEKIELLNRKRAFASVMSRKYIE